MSKYKVSCNYSESWQKDNPKCSSEAYLFNLRTDPIKIIIRDYHRELTSQLKPYINFEKENYNHFSYGFNQKRILSDSWLETISRILEINEDKYSEKDSEEHFQIEVVLKELGFCLQILTSHLELPEGNIYKFKNYRRTKVKTFKV